MTSCAPDGRRVEMPFSYYLPEWKLEQHLVHDHGYPEAGTAQWDPELFTQENHRWEHDGDGRHSAPNHVHPA